MIPAIGLILIGRARWSVPLPLPILLAWPFVLVALGGVTLAERMVGRRDTRRADHGTRRVVGAMSALGSEGRCTRHGRHPSFRLVDLGLLEGRETDGH